MSGELVNIKLRIILLPFVINGFLWQNPKKVIARVPISAFQLCILYVKVKDFVLFLFKYIRILNSADKYNLPRL